jgi:hypothetical protein
VVLLEDKYVMIPTLPAACIPARASEVVTTQAAGSAAPDFQTFARTVVGVA